MFGKKNKKTVRQKAKAQTKKTAVKSGKVQTHKTITKNETAQPGKGVTKDEKAQDRSDAVLAKLLEIEKEARLEQARDRVDQLEDDEIAVSIEELLKIIMSGE